MRKLITLGLALVTLPGIAKADIIKLNFDTKLTGETLPTGISVGDTYSAEGISFTGFTTFSATGINNTSAPNIAVGTEGGYQVMQVNDGFTALSLTAGADYVLSSGFKKTVTPAEIWIMSGNDGTGTLLAHYTINGSLSPTATSGVLDNFEKIDFSKFGTAHSMVLSAAPYQAGMDAITITTAKNSSLAPVPEPASVALLGVGGAFLVGSRRRNSKEEPPVNA